jgi:tetratricopeptide (TPR) repeat protein
MKSGLISPVLAGLILLGACNNQETRDPEDRSVLLEEPYREITDSINNDPKNATLYERRAALLTEGGQLDLAEADLLKRYELEPSEKNAEQLVNMLFMTGKSREAVRLLDKLIKEYPQNPQFQRRYSEALTNNGQISAAISSFDQILATDSTDFEAWFERGLLYLEEKDTAKAVQDLEHSFRLQPLQLSALTLANIYAETKNARAIQLADLVISRDSTREMADPYFIKGIYYVNTGQPSKALDMFNACIRLNWKFQEAYVEKGIIYFEAGNLDEALQQFKLAATVSNTYPEAYYWQGRCYEALNMNEEALANYRRAYALDREFHEAVEGAARVEGKISK